MYWVFQMTTTTTTELQVALDDNSVAADKRQEFSRRLRESVKRLSYLDSRKRDKFDRYFLGYQLRWLADDSRIKIWEKSRRIGATYVQSFEDVRDIVLKKEYTPGRPVRKVYFTSADESAAKEYIDYCGQWAKMFNIGAKAFGEVVLDSDKKITAMGIEFSNGGKIYALTSNPKRFRSKGGKVVLDEFAWHDDQAGMWKAAKPSAMWGYPIRVLSTHHGQQCLYFRFVQDAKAQKVSWSLHTVTIFDAVADGVADKICGRPLTEDERVEWLYKEYEDCRSEDVWNEEYCCLAIDATTAFVPYETTYLAEAENLLMSLEQLNTLREGDLYAGWDVARKRHFSVLWISQKLGDVRYTRHVKAFSNTRFKIQMDYLDRVMQLKRLRRICIDQTGIGLLLVEQAQDKYGKKVEGVTFTNANKEELAEFGKSALEDRRARIPPDQTIRDSFHSVKKIVVGGNIRFDADATDETGHADHWWAYCLAEMAAKSNAGPVRVKSRPRKNRVSIIKGY
jgi:phage FluMu gp28-like protein